MFSRKQKTEYITKFVARLLSLLYAVFISIFSLDVFDEHLSFWKTVLALFIHLIPTFIILFIFLLSWKKEWLSGILCLLLAIVYFYFSWGKFKWDVYCLIAGPLIMIGILYLLSWFYKSNSKKITA